MALADPLMPMMDALLIILADFGWPLLGLLLLLPIGYGLVRMTGTTAAPPGEPSATPAAEPPATPVIDSSDEPPITRLGQYRIGELLGQGSMGKVYLGWDVQTGREVAIKILVQPPTAATSHAEEPGQRFLHGAALASRFRHPGIVHIHAWGEEAGLSYAVMERLTGYPLERHTLATRPLLPVAQVILTVARLAMTLDHLHRHRVVHRDIKPANIFFDPATRQVKIMDFGIAREMADERADQETARSGATRLVAGTPYYLSPEQLMGKPVDGRADLFSLGVVLFQLLTGQLPFPAREMDQLLIQISREPPVDLLDLRPTLPACLRAIAGRTLQKEPNKRYQTGRQLTEDLLLCVKSQVKASRKSGLYRPPAPPAG
ncbi:MAG: serine/threonine protein kinase [Magnetococcus sp. DMHC-8]